MQLFKRGNAWLTAEQLIEYNKNNSVVILGDKKINETEEEYDIEEEDTEELEEVGEVEEDIDEDIDEEVPTEDVENIKEEKNKANKSKKK